jgi:hypothetical protein
MNKPKSEARSDGGRTNPSPRSWLMGLPPIKLYRSQYQATAGIVGIDASGRLLVEAGEAGGMQYVSVIATRDQLDQKVREVIACKMIAIWETFARGGPNDGDGAP